jgi:uncharacterized protein
MNPFSLLIKPASADCNLRCPYCFYLGKAALYPGAEPHRMSSEVLERLVFSYMATDQPQYVFGWQGGEPTLMGAEFFREVTRLQQQYGRPGSVVTNGLQTNGTLVDDALAAHLAEYRFLVGVSLDGPAEIHNHYRRDAHGQGSHAAVLDCLARLRRHGVEFNVLTLVTSANVGQAAEVYRYLLEQGVAYHQYIPCVEFDAQGRPRPWTITGEQWGEFLCALFDEWAPAAGRVSVRLFDALLASLLGQPTPLCHLGTDCRQYFVVEYNGDVYPCDFFVTPETRLGSILEDSWEALQESAVYREFGPAKAQWNRRCAGCEYLRWCAGDCLKHRYRAGRDPRELSWLCEGWRQFYGHALPRLRERAAQLRSGDTMLNSAEKPSMVSPDQTVGRNDPCPCGSGKKYKKCCGARA